MIIRNLSVFIFLLSLQGPGVTVLLSMSAQSRSIEVLGQSTDINEWAGPQHLPSPHGAQTFVKGQTREVFACRHLLESYKAERGFTARVWLMGRSVKSSGTVPFAR